MPHFKKYKLGELIEYIVDNRGKNPPFVSSGKELIESTCIVGSGKYLDYSLITKYVSDETYNNWFRTGHPQKNDLLIATVGANIGSTVIMKESRGSVAQNIIALRTKKELCASHYLYYLLSSKDGQNDLQNLNIGSAQPSIRVPHLLNYEIELPSLPTQTRIAAILSSLDDKIELNRRTNHTLEQIAQTLFKKYFVDDIDPENLPEGWRWGKIGEFINSISATHKFPKEEIIFLNTGDIYEGKVLHNNYSAVDTLPGQAKKSIKRNDILLSEIRPANRRFAYINFEAEDYVVSTKLMVLRSLSSIDSLFFYFILTSKETLSYLQNLAEARSGTFPQITFDQVSEIDFIFPANDVLNNFIEKVLKPTYKMIFKNENEIETLSKIRDSLLPKLMSGEIEVNATKKELVDQ